MKHVFTVLCSLCLSAAVFAQTNSKAISWVRTSAADSAVLAKDRSQAPKEIPVPKFVVKTADNSFYMAIGGQVNPIMGVDLGNNLYNVDGAGISFVTQLIPVPSTLGHRSDFYINPLQANVDFQVVGLAGTPNQITGYIKFGTNGINSNLHLSRAYITWRNFTAGLKLTMFQDDYACQPPTIDPEGPSGCISTVVHEISYKSKNYNGFQFAIGIDQPAWYSSNGIYRGKDYPEFDGTQVANYADAEQIVPDIPMWVQYGTSNFNRVRVSGIIRNFSYRDLIANKTKHLVGWGAMLSGNINPVKPVIFYYQIAYGKGIGAYLQDLAGMPLSFVPTDAHLGKMQASPMMGVNFGFTFNLTSKLQVNIMGSESRIWDVRNYAIHEDSSNYKYALYAAGNVFYNITPYLQWGIEYLWGRRQTWNMGGANDSRLQTQLMFTI